MKLYVSRVLRTFTVTSNGGWRNFNADVMGSASLRLRALMRLSSCERVICRCCTTALKPSAGTEIFALEGSVGLKPAWLRAIHEGLGTLWGGLLN